MSPPPSTHPLDLPPRPLLARPGFDYQGGAWRLYKGAPGQWFTIWRDGGGFGLEGYLDSGGAGGKQTYITAVRLAKRGDGAGAASATLAQQPGLNQFDLEGARPCEVGWGCTGQPRCAQLTQEAGTSMPTNACASPLVPPAQWWRTMPPCRRAPPAPLAQTSQCRRCRRGLMRAAQGSAMRRRAPCSPPPSWACAWTSGGPRCPSRRPTRGLATGWTCELGAAGWAGRAGGTARSGVCATSGRAQHSTLPDSRTPLLRPPSPPNSYLTILEDPPPPVGGLLGKTYSPPSARAGGAVAAVAGGGPAADAAS